MKSKAAFEQVQSKHGSLQYLKNLEKKYEKDDDIEESCPVCQNAIDETVRSLKTLRCFFFLFLCCL